MARPGEFDYYATRSGLPSGSLSDHKLAYFKVMGAPLPTTLNEAEYVFYLNANSLVRGSVDFASARKLYYAQKLGHGGDIDSLMAEFFLSPPPDTPPNTMVSTPASGDVGADVMIAMKVDPNPDVVSGVTVYRAMSADGVVWDPFSYYDDPTYDGTFWNFTVSSNSLVVGEWARYKFVNAVGPVDIGSYAQFRRV